MKKRLGLLALLLAPAMAYGAITAEQKYLLNSQMGAVASKVQLGTLLDAADTVVSSDITNETILSEDIDDGTIVNADLNASAAIASTKLAGFTHTAETLLGIEKMAVVTWVFGTDGGAESTIGLGVTLPDNAIVTKVIRENHVICDSGTDDDGTIKLTIPTDGDIDAALTCDGSAVTVASVLPSGTPIKTTAARELSAVVATSPLTVGSITWFVYYVQGS